MAPFQVDHLHHRDHRDDDDDDDAILQRTDSSDTSKMPLRSSSICLLHGNEDDDGSRSLFDIVRERLVPQCTAILEELDDDYRDIRDDVCFLLRDLKHKGKPRTLALQKLYLWTDRDRPHNRMALICTTKFNLVADLLPCLCADAAAADRRRALLLLNNLCVPVENKAVLVLGSETTTDKLLTALVRMLHRDDPNSYLVAAILFQLSHLDDAKVWLMNANVPMERSLTLHQPTDKLFLKGIHATLLRVIESVLLDVSPFLFQTSVKSSVQSETFRFLMSMMRHLVTAKQNAVVVATETIIPTLALDCLARSQRDLGYWTRDSPEEASLMLLVHVCNHVECLEALRRLEYRTALEKLRGKGGIHEVRALSVLKLLMNDDQREGEEKKVD